jgi:hypothetical protein
MNLKHPLIKYVYYKSLKQIHKSTNHNANQQKINKASDWYTFSCKSTNNHNNSQIKTNRETNIIIKIKYEINFCATISVKSNLPWFQQRGRRWRWMMESVTEMMILATVMMISAPDVVGEESCVWNFRQLCGEIR